ncbi:MAG: AbrB/MazE/SpoVT family DNA-binding domain-containing protein [Alphaproteobacteria bacterium]|nr:AbrB/MazE/SpoVT family DNA-binding domain-containing protein [Alphaproteobacteria bacterium]
MQSQISRWGNSLGLRVPSDMARRLGLSAGTAVEIEARDDGALVVTKARRRYTLEELVAGMTPDNAHPALVDDAPRGEELL